MPRALIVLAHPSPASLNFSMKEAAKQSLIEAGYEVEESDLYRMNYNPVLSINDYPDETDPEHFNIAAAQTRAWETQHYSQDILSEMEKIKNADLIVLQFPLWHSAYPAMLGGWMQRNFVLKFAIFAENRILAGKRVLVSTTTGAPKEAYVADNLGGIKYVLKHLLHLTLQQIGFNVLDPHCVYMANTDNKEYLAECVQEFKEKVKNIDNWPELVWD